MNLGTRYYKLKKNKIIYARGQNVYNDGGTNVLGNGIYMVVSGEVLIMAPKKKHQEREKELKQKLRKKYIEQNISGNNSKNANNDNKNDNGSDGLDPAYGSANDLVFTPQEQLENSEVISCFKIGKIFGDIEPLVGCNTRACTAITHSSDTRLLCFHSAVDAFTLIPTVKEQKERIDFIKSLNIFAGIDNTINNNNPDQHNQNTDLKSTNAHNEYMQNKLKINSLLFHFLSNVIYRRNRYIIQEKKKSSHMYILQAGDCKIRKRIHLNNNNAKIGYAMADVCQMGPGSMFGINKISNQSVICTSVTCKCIAFDKHNALKILPKRTMHHIELKYKQNQNWRKNRIVKLNNIIKDMDKNVNTKDNTVLQRINDSDVGAAHNNNNSRQGKDMERYENNDTQQVKNVEKYENGDSQQKILAMDAFNDRYEINIFPHTDGIKNGSYTQILSNMKLICDKLNNNNLSRDSNATVNNAYVGEDTEKNDDDISENGDNDDDHCENEDEDNNNNIRKKLKQNNKIQYQIDSCLSVSRLGKCWSNNDQKKILKEKLYHNKTNGSIIKKKKQISNGRIRHNYNANKNKYNCNKIKRNASLLFGSFFNQKNKKNDTIKLYSNKIINEIFITETKSENRQKNQNNFALSTRSSSKLHKINHDMDIFDGDIFNICSNDTTTENETDCLIDRLTNYYETKFIKANNQQMSLQLSNITNLSTNDSKISEFLAPTSVTAIHARPKTSNLSKINTAHRHYYGGGSTADPMCATGTVISNKLTTRVLVPSRPNTSPKIKRNFDSFGTTLPLRAALLKNRKIVGTKLSKSHKTKKIRIREPSASYMDDMNFKYKNSKHTSHQQVHPKVHRGPKPKTTYEALLKKYCLSGRNESKNKKIRRNLMLRGYGGKYLNLPGKV